MQTENKIMTENVSSKTKIGFFSIILLGINGIIGSGIFLLPGQVTAIAHQDSLLMYGFVMLLVLIIASSFAKCASFFDRNGGAYIYAKEAFGDFAGFQIGIMRWAVGIIAWATMAVAFITALSTVWPFLLEEPIRSIFIFFMITGLGIINCLGVSWIKSLNNVVTIAKIIPLIGFILLGLFFLKGESLRPDYSIFDSSEKSFGASALLIFYAFSGFENLGAAAGEMHNPKKNLPKALMLAVIVSSVLCVLIQAISMSVLHGNLAASMTPVADVADILLGSYGKWFVLIAMIISIGGINICNSFVLPRSAEALAIDGILPKWISFRNRFDTPICAILVSAILTILVALFGSFTQLATISVIARFVQYTSTCSAVLVLTREERKTMPFFKKCISVSLPIIGLIGIAWLMCQATASQLYWGLGALLLGLPFYFLRKQTTQSIQVVES